MSPLSSPVARVNQVMGGRRLKSLLETHHTAVSDLTKKMLLRLDPGKYKNYTPGQWTNLLDEMPAYIMDKRFHTTLPENTSIVNFRDFHAALRENMKLIDRDNTSEVLEALEVTYRELAGAGPNDPIPDAMLIAREWLKTKGIQ